MICEDNCKIFEKIGMNRHNLIHAFQVGNRYRNANIFIPEKYDLETPKANIQRWSKIINGLKYYSFSKGYFAKLWKRDKNRKIICKKDVFISFLMCREKYNFSTGNRKYFYSGDIPVMRICPMRDTIECPYYLERLV